MSSSGDSADNPTPPEAILNTSFMTELAAVEQRVTAAVSQSLQKTLEPLLRLIPSAAGTTSSGSGASGGVTDEVNPPAQPLQDQPGPSGSLA